jgi:hypothetical protein
MQSQNGRYRMTADTAFFSASRSVDLTTCIKTHFILLCKPVFSGEKTTPFGEKAVRSIRLPDRT